MINPETYYTVQGWMVSELGLKGNALAVYAIIYGFTQDGASVFSGSSSYICEWLGCSKKTALTTLADLTAAGLLKKTTTYRNGISFCDYVAVRTPTETAQDTEEEITPPEKNLHQGGVKITPGWCKNYTGVEKNLHQGGVKITPHNTRDNYRDNYRDIDRDNNRDIGAAQNAPEPPAPEKPKKQEPVRHKYGEYKNVLLTDEQLADLRKLFPYDLQNRIERLSEYIASTGRSYKNHFATIKAWARKDQQDGFRANRTGKPGNIGPNGITIDPTKTDMDGAFR